MISISTRIYDPARDFSLSAIPEGGWYIELWRGLPDNIEFEKGGSGEGKF